MKDNGNAASDGAHRTEQDIGDNAIKKINDVVSSPKGLSGLITEDRKQMFYDILLNQVSKEEQEEIKNILGQELWDQYLEEAKRDFES